jgi:hypothetical protein
MKLLIITLCFLLIGTVAKSQSPFKAEPLLQFRPTSFRSMTATVTPSVIPLSTTEPDSIVNAWRFSIPVSPGGFTFAGVYQASAGLAYGFQKQDYSYATQTYTVLWSASLVWIPINTATGLTSIKDIATFGALYGIKNNLVNVGPFYNPNAPGTFKDKSGIWLTTTINLNN